MILQLSFSVLHNHSQNIPHPNLCQHQLLAFQNRLTVLPLNPFFHPGARAILIIGSRCFLLRNLKTFQSIPISLAENLSPVPWPLKAGESALSPAHLPLARSCPHHLLPGPGICRLFPAPGFLYKLFPQPGLLSPGVERAGFSSVSLRSTYSERWTQVEPPVPSHHALCLMSSSSPP